MSILQPSQVDIKNISLSNHDKSDLIGINHKKTKLLEYIQAIDFYESVFSPFITAEITMIDGGNFRERYNISGGEDFEIEFVGFGTDIPLKYSLAVNEIVSILPNTNLRSKNVTLRLASKELLIDSSTTVSKSYAVGTKEIIQDLIGKTLKSKKEVYVEDTKDLPIIIIPFLSPLKAVDFVRQRLVSPKFSSSTFMFYEDSEGYKLTTAEGLVERSLNSKAALQTFFQREGISQRVKGNPTDLDSHHLFSNLTIQNPFNIGEMFRNGSLKTVVTQFDITTKQYQKKVFGNNPSSSPFRDYTQGNNPSITNTLYKEYSETENKPLFLPFSKYKDTDNTTSNFLYDTVAERLCYSSLFTQQRMYVDIPGNTRIKAGSIIELKIPRYSSLNEIKQNNEMDSGKYLVTAVKHSITVSDTSKYDTHLELMRFGRGEFIK